MQAGEAGLKCKTLRGEMAQDMLSSKQNALGFRSRKVKWKFRVASINLQDLSYSGQLQMMCSRVSKMELSQRHTLDLVGKKRCRYSPVGAWFVIMRVAQAQREGEFEKWASHAPPLEQDGLIMCPSLSVSSRNWRPSSQWLGSTCATSILTSHLHPFDRTPKKFYRERHRQREGFVQFRCRLCGVAATLPCWASPRILRGFQGALKRTS